MPIVRHSNICELVHKNGELVIRNRRVYSHGACNILNYITGRPAQSYMAIYGGSDNAITGTGGTGIFTSATIDGFGSIFVSGGGFATNNASIVPGCKSVVGW